MAAKLVVQDLQKRFGDQEVLRQLSAEVGLDAERVDEVLFSDEFTDDVLVSDHRAAHLGARGVPFFLIDGQYTFSGALPVPAMRNALERAWALRHDQLSTTEGVTQSARPAG